MKRTLGIVITSVTLAGFAAIVVIATLARGPRGGFPRASSDPFALMLSERIGPLHIGMPEELLRRVLGPPNKAGELDYCAATGYYSKSFEYPGVFVEVHSEQSATDKEHSLYCTGSMDEWRDSLADRSFSFCVGYVAVTAPCKYKTTKGIGIGSPVDVVRRKYGAYEDTVNAGRSAVCLVAGSLYGGVLFEFVGGRCSEIKLGAFAE